MKKNIIIFFCCISLLFGLVVLGGKYRTIHQSFQNNENIFVKQTVFAVAKNLTIKSGTTALGLIENTHLVVKKGEKQNAFITGIDGRLADTRKREFWAFYVNGKQAQVGAGSYVIKNNDTIEWKIETY